MFGVDRLNGFGDTGIVKVYCVSMWPSQKSKIWGSWFAVSPLKARMSDSQESDLLATQSPRWGCRYIVEDSHESSRGRRVNDLLRPHAAGKSGVCQEAWVASHKKARSQTIADWGVG